MRGFGYAVSCRVIVLCCLGGGSGERLRRCVAVGGLSALLCVCRCPVCCPQYVVSRCRANLSPALYFTVLIYAVLSGWCAVSFAVLWRAICGQCNATVQCEWWSGAVRCSARLPCDAVGCRVMPCDAVRSRAMRRSGHAQSVAVMFDAVRFAAPLCGSIFPAKSVRR